MEKEDISLSTVMVSAAEKSAALTTGDPVKTGKRNPKLRAVPSKI